MNYRSALVFAALSFSIVGGCNESSDPPVNGPTTAPGGIPTAAPVARTGSPAEIPAMNTGMTVPPSTGPTITGVVTVDTLTWDLPLGWGQRAATGMRLATIVAPGELDVAVTRFPGDTGGMLKNVNRWRGQIGLAEITETELPTNLKSVTTAAGEAMIVDLMAATGNSRLLTATLAANGNTWFFKIIADKDKLALIRADFETFIKSIRPAM